MNEIKALDESIQVYDASQATSESREQLEQWRAKCHEKIDQLFEKKFLELDQYLKLRVEQQTQNVQQLQEKLPSPGRREGSGPQSIRSQLVDFNRRSTETRHVTYSTNVHADSLLPVDARRFDVSDH